MADKKISQLTVASTPLDGTEVMPIVKSGSTVKVPVSDLTAGRAVSALSATLTGGTVNGVLYLNASKAAASGSALAFDGTNLSTTGTASATKLIPTGNVTAGNGMYLPAADTLAWSNSGSETMRLDSSGNLGIGTNSPKAKLQSTGAAATTVPTGGSATGSAQYLTNVNDAYGMLFGIAANGVGWIQQQRTDATNTQYTLLLNPIGGSVVAGGPALATNAVNGFLYVPTCAGTPTGTPTEWTGRAPIVVDTTNNKLYFYSGGQWRDAGP